MWHNKFFFLTLVLFVVGCGDVKNNQPNDSNLKVVETGPACPQGLGMDLNFLFEKAIELEKKDPKIPEENFKKDLDIVIKLCYKIVEKYKGDNGCKTPSGENLNIDDITQCQAFEDLLKKHK